MNEEKDVKVIFAERLKSLMNEKALNIKMFSKEINIPTSTLSDWLREIATPSIENIPKIARYFSVSTDYLLGMTDFES